jgi:hypothetical protein
MKRRCISGAATNGRLRKDHKLLNQGAEREWLADSLVA